MAGSKPKCTTCNDDGYFGGVRCIDCADPYEPEPQPEPTHDAFGRPIDWNERREDDE